jgi:hypothetical protein
MGTFIQANDANDNWTDFRQFGDWTVPGAPLSGRSERPQRNSRVGRRQFDDAHRHHKP